ncbi:hypothetical protein VTK26DRAFT_244 [Humicola hyalothermophila]
MARGPGGITAGSSRAQESLAKTIQLVDGWAGISGVIVLGKYIILVFTPRHCHKLSGSRCYVLYPLPDQ